MSRLSDKLQEANLTPQQKKIGDYVFRNQARVANMSSQELAKEIGVSDASVIRFSRAIGYKGFSDLKDDIYNALIREKSYSVRHMQLSDRYDVMAGHSSMDYLSQDFLETMNYNITRTFQQNSEKSYEKLADMILEADRKYVSGLRGCIGVSHHFTRLMKFTVRGVIYLAGENDAAENLGILQDIRPSDIFILFAFARYYKTDMMLVKIAKEHGAKICVITDSLMAPMTSYADITFLAETSHISFFNSAIGAEMIAEYIVTLVSRKNSKEYKERAKERDIMTEDLRLR